MATTIVRKTSGVPSTQWTFQRKLKQVRRKRYFLPIFKYILYEIYLESIFILTIGVLFSTSPAITCLVCSNLILWCQPTARKRDNIGNMIWPFTVDDGLSSNCLILLELRLCLLPLRSVMGFEIAQIVADGINFTRRAEVEHIYD